MKRFVLFFSITAAIALTGCRSAKATQPMDLLTGTVWELSSINGQKVDAGSNRNGLPTASFNTELKISGNGGCNTYSGSYNLNENEGINISQVMSTKMFCEGSIENEYFKELGKVNMAKIDKDKLTLMEGVDERLVFVPKK
ncbi:META domain-containing protein [Flavobacterium sp. DGU11]|uniref:META domain-containing protein n=1 Tax=Flavobacterium arundinis TaxID=3139143 RepID=A0ABU9I0A8_9FLAO